MECNEEEIVLCLTRLQQQNDQTRKIVGVSLGKYKAV